MIERLSELLTDIRTAAAVAMTTVGNSMGVAFEYLPDNLLTKVATVIGIALSCVLIYTHIKRHLREERAAELDYQIKMQQNQKGPK